jgi:hypothetical protein
VKRVLGFAASSGAIIAIIALLAIAAFPGEDRQRAIIMSAGIAFVTQVSSFGLVLLLAPANVFAGWGAGLLVRGITFALHAVLGIRLLGLSAEASLLSLAAFLFATTLIEPLFIPQPPVPARAN